jgi:protein arginine N-methyltransferase 5
MDTASYVHYLHHLHDTQPALSDADKYTDGYTDYLQAPLQPLMDHLESSTYEVFEQDPIKYRQYEEAVYRALLDRAATSSSSSIAPTVIMVVGAGRGPLVQNCINAAKSASNHAVKIYAVEKNPSALVVLRHKNATVWGGKVTIVHSDMRYYEAPELADILVSELLGSFGDNVKLRGNT